ncbi:MAG: hypothetical protein ABIU85_02365 [Methylotenera sp.]
MAKHLTKVDISAIINIIHNWEDEKLTWDDICESAINVIGKKPTRQSLNSNFQIKEAYLLKKIGLKTHGPKIATPSSLKVAADRITKQQNEIDSLKAKNSSLLEQFVKWQYNSYKYGLKEHQLNEPLPRIDRERTESKIIT